MLNALQERFPDLILMHRIVRIGKRVVNIPQTSFPEDQDDIKTMVKMMFTCTKKAELWTQWTLHRRLLAHVRRS